MKPSYQRLESLDVLRGFDLFCLVALEGVLHPLGRAIDAPWYNDFLWCFSHVLMLKVYKSIKNSF